MDLTEGEDSDINDENIWEQSVLVQIKDILIEIGEEDCIDPKNDYVIWSWMFCWIPFFKIKMNWQDLVFISLLI